MTWAPKIIPPWSTTDLEGLLTDALKVLSEIGVECVHLGARSRLAQWGEVSFVGDRVCFSKQSVRDHLEARRIKAVEPPDEATAPFSLHGCYAAPNYCDPETGEVRPASSDESALMARFWDARGNSGVVPLVPGDVPPGMVTLAAERIALVNSRDLGGGLTVMDPEEIRFLTDMNLAAGRRFRLTEQIGISPLRFNEIGLDSALAFADDPDLDVKINGFIPMAGATCPLDPRSAVVQSVAETIAFDVLCAAMSFPGNLITRTEPFDFQYASIVFGSAEWCLYRVLTMQMSEYLTVLPVRNGRFRSMAKRPDAQASCERTASVLWQALLGARSFGAVGQLSIDEVFSPQQAVLDKEILGYVERVMGGIPLNEPIDPVNLIREGVEEGSFAGVDDTVSRFRDLCYFPDIFRHWTVARWRSEGSQSILAQAWDIARKEIELSDHELSHDALSDVDRVYAKAEEWSRNRC